MWMLVWVQLLGVSGCVDVDGSVGTTVECGCGAGESVRACVGVDTNMDTDCWVWCR